MSEATPGDGLTASLLARMQLMEASLRRIDARLARLELDAETKPTVRPIEAPPPPSPRVPIAPPAAEPPAVRDPVIVAAPQSRDAVTAPSPPARRESAAPTPSLASTLAARARENRESQVFAGAAAPGSEASRIFPESPRPRGAYQLEKLIGGRWYAVLGGLVVIVGVGFFFQYAVQQGWMRVLPPGAKCIAGGVFGAALLCAAEFLRRRVNPWAAVGLNAAGLGSMYLSAYAAYGRYELVGPGLGLVLIASCALLGVFIGARSRLSAVSIVSTLGAYLAPVLIGVRAAPVWVIPAYLLMLQTVGLVLCAWRGGGFVSLRVITWWCTLAFGAVWVLLMSRGHTALALAFLGASWLAVHIELLASANLCGLAAAPADASVRTLPAVWRPLIGSFSSTAWAVALGVLVVQAGARVPDWLPPLVGVGATMLLGLMLAGNLRVLRDPPRTDPERLGAAMLVQTGALLIAVVSLALTGWMESVTWLAMGLAAVAAGRWIGAVPLLVYGMIVLLIGTGRVAFVEPWLGVVTSGGENVFGLQLTRWSALMALAGGAWLACAALMWWRGPRDDAQDEARTVPERAGLWARERREVLGGTARRVGAEILVGTGLTLVACGAINPATSQLSFVAVCFTLMAAVVLVGWRLGGLVLACYGAAVGLLTTMMLFVSVQPWKQAADAAVLAFAGLRLTWASVLVLYGAAAWYVLARRLAQRQDQACRAGAIASAAAAFVLLLVSLAHQDANESVVIAAWTLVCVGVGLTRALHPRLFVDVMALVALLPIAGAWAGHHIGRGWSTFGDAPLVHRGVLTAALIAAAAVGLGVWAVRGGLRASARAVEIVRPGAWVLAGAVMFVASSFEVARVAERVTADDTVRQAAVSVWWGVCAVAMLVFGFLRPAAAVRRCGLALLGIATAKALLFDLTQVSLGWRVISVLGLGLLMLGVGVVYARLTKGQQSESLSQEADARV